MMMIVGAPPDTLRAFELTDAGSGDDSGKKFLIHKVIEEGGFAGRLVGADFRIFAV